MGAGRERMRQKPKVGAGWGKAAVRQGAKEVAQVLPAFPESVRVVEEPGTPGNPTPQEVASERRQVEPEMG